MKKHFLLSSIICFLTIFYSLYQHRKTSSQKFCQLIDEKFLYGLSSKQVEDCQNIPDTDLLFSQWWENRSKWLESFNESHLFLIGKKGSQLLWEGKAKENGFRMTQFSKRYFVHKTQTEDHILQKGDELISWNGVSVQDLTSVEHIYFLSGRLAIKRKNKELTLDLNPKEVSWSLWPRKLTADDWTLIQIPAFRKEGFSEKTLKKLMGSINKDKPLIIDLRGNSGGNMSAAINMMSYFFCEETKLGEFKKPNIEKTETFVPKLDHIDMISQVDQDSNLDIVTQKTEFCLNNELIVFVDKWSASASEFFAGSLQDLKRAQVVGSVTAGQTQVAVWYPFINNHPEYYLIIPRAQILTASGRYLEGIGVYPDYTIKTQVAHLKSAADNYLSYYYKYLK